MEEPYRFVPPWQGTWFSTIFQNLLMLPYLKHRCGIVDHQIHGIERLQQSLADKDGILLCPNHCRDSDPLVMGLICRRTNSHIHLLASWHVFRQSWLESTAAWLLGGFSIYREGQDLQSLTSAIRIVAEARRPLVVFPEGAISRSNDRLLRLMRGASCIARAAARRRQHSGCNGKVMIFPIAIRYELLGSLNDSVSRTLSEIEKRTFWKTHEHLPPIQRIQQLGQALVAAREVDISGQTGSGRLRDRIEALIEGALQPLERRWLQTCRRGDRIQRVKDLRSAILHELMDPQTTSEQRADGRRALIDCYYAQALSLYPEDYLDQNLRGVVTPERVAETVHRMEEDLTDSITLQPEWRVHFYFGSPIQVTSGSAQPRAQDDPIMTQLRAELLQQLQVQDYWPAQRAVAVPDPD